MDNIIEAISELIGKTVTVILIGGSIAILAGEIRLAALKKVSQGTGSLSRFTSNMTGMKFP